MTNEKEAKKKWCPFVRQFSVPNEGASGSFNRYGGGKPADGSSCIASECMAWRWTSAQRDYGYCGLAGKLLKDTVN